MHEKGSRRSKSSVDDGSGKVDVWRIEHFDMVPVEEELHGQFFAGDSYVILYTYYVGRKECYVVYFWQGQVIILVSILRMFIFRSDSYIVRATFINTSKSTA